MVEHVAQERDVVRPAAADHGARPGTKSFSELDPVAVRVVDVDDPHRVVQLEDDAYVDPLSLAARRRP